MSFSSLELSSRVRHWLSTRPALENSRSTGAELNGTANSCKAKVESGVVLRSV